MNGLLVAAFIFAFGNTAYHLGAGDTLGAVVSGAITALVVGVGIVTSDR